MSQSRLPHDHGGIFEQNRQAMPDSGAFETAAEMFKILGDSTRLRIFWLLCHCEECVINLSSLMEMKVQSTRNLMFRAISKIRKIMPFWIFLTFFQ